MCVCRSVMILCFGQVPCRFTDAGFISSIILCIWFGCVVHALPWVVKAQSATTGCHWETFGSMGFVFLHRAMARRKKSFRQPHNTILHHPQPLHFNADVRSRWINPWSLHKCDKRVASCVCLPNEDMVVTRVCSSASSTVMGETKVLCGHLVWTDGRYISGRLTTDV